MFLLFFIVILPCQAFQGLKIVPQGLKMVGQGLKIVPQGLKMVARSATLWPSPQGPKPFGGSPEALGPGPGPSEIFLGGTRQLLGASQDKVLCSKCSTLAQPRMESS